MGEDRDNTAEARACKKLHKMFEHWGLFGGLDRTAGGIVRAWQGLSMQSRYAPGRSFMQPCWRLMALLLKHYKTCMTVSKSIHVLMLQVCLWTVHLIGLRYCSIVFIFFSLALVHDVDLMHYFSFSAPQSFRLFRILHHNGGDVLSPF